MGLIMLKWNIIQKGMLFNIISYIRLTLYEDILRKMNETFIKTNLLKEY